MVRSNRASAGVSELSASQIVADWITCLHAGSPVTSHGLTLIPLTPTAPAPIIAYETLTRALTANHVRITEFNGGTVPLVQVEHRGPVPVLLLDGDRVDGGRQNRVMNTSVLVPIGIDFPVPVSCVEQGRWHAQRVDFDAGDIVPPALRMRKSRSVSHAYQSGRAGGADQGEVWSSVAEELRVRATYSASSDLSDAYRVVEGKIDALRASLTFPPGDPVGVAAIVGGKVAAIDIFDRTETLGEFWPRLVRSYAYAAVDAPTIDARGAIATITRILDAARLAAPTTHDSPGLGIDVRLSGAGVHGASLVHAGNAIHTALFVDDNFQAGASPDAIVIAEPTVPGTSDAFQRLFGGGGAVSTTTPRATVPALPVRRYALANTVRTTAQIDGTTIRISRENLLEASVAALILSANKRLVGGSGITAAVEGAAGRAYTGERDRLLFGAPATGFPRGDAVVTGSGALRDGEERRILLHAVTMKYENGHRVPSTPDIVYAAVRKALEKAEIYGCATVGTYLMATRAVAHGATPWATAPASTMARALFDAIADHARIARQVREVTIFERSEDRFDLATATLQAMS